jgi:hypothetical protein
VIHNGLSRRRDVVVARDEKEVKGAYLITRTIRNKLCLRIRRRKEVGKVKCCLLFQPRRLIFFW